MAGRGRGKGESLLPQGMWNSMVDDAASNLSSKSKGRSGEGRGRGRGQRGGRGGRGRTNEGDGTRGQQVFKKSDWTCPL